MNGIALVGRLGSLGNELCILSKDLVLDLGIPVGQKTQILFKSADRELRNVPHVVEAVVANAAKADHVIERVLTHFGPRLYMG